MAVVRQVVQIHGAGAMARYVFVLDAVLMTPFAALSLAAPASWSEAGKPADNGKGADNASVGQLLADSKILLSNNVYVCIVLGYAAYTFTVGGFAVYAPQYLMFTFNLDQAVSTLTFGGITAGTGLLGTLAGGW